MELVSVRDTCGGRSLRWPQWFLPPDNSCPCVVSSHIESWSACVPESAVEGKSSGFHLSLLNHSGGRQSHALRLLKQFMEKSIWRRTEASYQQPTPLHTSQVSEAPWELLLQPQSSLQIVQPCWIWLQSHEKLNQHQIPDSWKW